MIVLLNLKQSYSCLIGPSESISIIPGITPAQISAIIAHIMLLVAFSVAMSPAFTALYIFQTLMNTINDNTAKTKKTTAYTKKMPLKKPTPYPKVSAENVAKVIICLLYTSPSPRDGL